MESLSGWGVKSRDKLISSIQDARARGVTLDRLVYALGIRHVGIGVAGVVAKEVRKKGKLLELVKEGNWTVAEEWDGVGGVIVDSLREWGRDEGNVKELERLVGAMRIEDVDGGDNGREGVWGGINVVFTGRLQTCTRKEAGEAAKRMGARVQKDVGKNTDILVRGEGGGGKVKKAEELGIRVMEEAEFADIADIK